MYPSSLSVLLLVLLLSVVTARETAPKDPLNFCTRRFFAGYKCDEAPMSTVVRGISAELLEKFRVAAEWATVSYCEDDKDRLVAGKVLCSVHNCALHPGKPKVGEKVRLDNDDGFVAIDDHLRTIVLSFRGTADFKNWKTDFDGRRVPTHWCQNCNVHRGFWKVWLRTKAQMLKAVDAALADYPDYKLVVTGHSLGGAIATLAATDIRRARPTLGNRTELYTFGSPRVGNTHFVTFATALSNQSYRITTLDDPVPKLPPVALGFLHLSPEYSIRHNPLNPRPKDVDVLQGYHNSHGNAGRPLKLCFRAHREYFGHVTTCEATTRPLHSRDDGGHAMKADDVVSSMVDSFSDEYFADDGFWASHRLNETVKVVQDGFINEAGC